MQKPHAMLLGFFLLGAGAVTCGCADGGQDGSATGTSQARLVVSNKGTSPAALHVTATDDTTASVAVDKTIDLEAGSVTVLDLALPPATYTFKADVVGGASGNTTLGTCNAVASLAAGATTEIQLAAQTSAAAATGGGSQGSAQVQINVDAAPQINGVDVQLGGSGADATVDVHVDASSPGGSALTFFWSGASLSAAVQGSSSLSLSAAAVAASATSAGSPVLHVVVQDAAGVAASADIALAVSASAAQGSMAPPTDNGQTAACLQAQAQCTATCSQGLGISLTGVTVDATCLAGCGTSFASCCAAP